MTSRTSSELRRIVTHRAVHWHAGTVGTIVTASTIAFSRVEHLSVWEGCYFSIVTMATIGYGDITPQTTAGQALTIALVLAGIIIHLSAVRTAVLIHRDRPG